MSSIIEKEWDILLVLDACRYSSFKTAIETLGWEGKLSLYKTKARNTVEYRDSWPKTPRDQQFFYVSGNPYINSKTAGNKFKVIDAFLWGWDVRHDVAAPEAVTDAMMTLTKFGERIVAHYMPPHLPFLGESNRLEKWEPYKSTLRRDRKLEVPLHDLESDVQVSVPFPSSSVPNAKGLFTFAEYLSREPRMAEEPEPVFEDFIQMVKQAYMSNLYLVLRDVKRILRYLRGAKVVVTSDHGCFLGEPYKKGYDPSILARGASVADVKKYGMWWHPPDDLEVDRNFNHPALSEVPWFEAES